MVSQVIISILIKLWSWEKNHVKRYGNKMGRNVDNISRLSSKIGVWICYIICINILALIRNSFKIILWYIFHDSYQEIWLINFFTLMSYLIMIVCGGWVGYSLQKNAILHSSLSVALGVIFTYLISGVSLDAYIYILKFTAIGFVLGGLGGGLGLMVRKNRYARVPSTDSNKKHPD